MDKVSKIKGIEQVKPMIHPFVIDDVILNDDEVEASLSREEIFKNAPVVENNEIKVPKVVG